jgi:hypothetical protein
LKCFEVVTSVSLTLDVIPAVLAIATAVSVILLAMSFSANISPAPARLWAAGALFFTLGMLLINARGQIPDAFSILLANWLLITAFAAFLAAANQLVGRSMRPAILGGVGAVVVFGVSVALGADLETRIAIISAFSIIASGLLARRFLEAGRNWAITLAAAAFLLNGLLAAGRLLGTFGVELVPGGTGTLHQLVMNGGVAMALIVPATLIFFALPALARGRVVAEQPALSVSTTPEGWELLRDRSVLVAPDGSEVRLTGQEYLLLKELTGQEEPVARVALNLAIGRDADNPKDRGIDIMISRVRRKCSEAGAELPVTSVRGIGYVFQGELRLGDG